MTANTKIMNERISIVLLACFIFLSLCILTIVHHCRSEGFPRTRITKRSCACDCGRGPVSVGAFFLSFFLFLSLSFSFFLFLSLSFSFFLFLSLSLSFFLFLSLSLSFFLFLSLSLSFSLFLSLSRIGVSGSRHTSQTLTTSACLKHSDFHKTDSKLGSTTS